MSSRLETGVAVLLCAGGLLIGPEGRTVCVGRTLRFDILSATLFALNRRELSDTLILCANNPRAQSPKMIYFV